MLRRSTRIALDVFLALVAISSLLAGVAIWRLSSEPVDLGFLTPRLEAGFDEASENHRIRIGETLLAWEGWDRAIDLHARDVNVLTKEGRLVAAFPEVSVSLSLRALLHGTFAPTEILLNEARVGLVRTTDGTFELYRRGAEEDPSEASFAELLPTLLERLLAAPDPGNALSYLERVVIADGALWVDDRVAGRVWRAPLDNLDLRREAPGLAGSLALGLEDDRSDLSDRSARASFVYNEASGVVSATGAFRGIDLPELAEVLPMAQPLSGIAVPLRGDFGISLDTDGRVERGRVKLSGGTGELTVPGFLETPIAVRDFALDASFMERSDTLNVSDAVLELGNDEGGPTLRFSGSIVRQRGSREADYTIDAEADGRSISMDSLARIWPEGVAKNARQWVLENLPAGRVNGLRTELRLHVPGGNFGLASLRHLAGGFDYEAVQVHYLRPLPPIEDIRGSATFGPDNLVFDVERGRSGELAVEGTRVAIEGFESKQVETLSVGGRVSGPLGAAFGVLDHERLGLLSKLGMESADATGQVLAELSLGFPLLDGLTFDEVEVSSDATLTDLVWPDFRDAHDLKSEKVALGIRKDAMTVSGDVEFAGVPMSVDWREAFAAGEASEAEISIPELGEDARERLGLDLSDHLEGPLGAELAYVGGTDGASTIRLDADLTPATLKAPELGWRKEPARTAHLEATLLLEGERLAEVRDAVLTAPDLELSGQGRLASDGETVAAIELDRFRVHRTDVQDLHAEPLGEGYDITIAHGTVDLAPFLADAGDGKADAEEEVVHTPLRVSAEGFERVYISEDRYFENMSLELGRSRQGWERLLLTAEVPSELWHAPGATANPEVSEDANRWLQIQFEPQGDGTQTLRAESNDFGAVLRALDALDTVEGGTVRLTGTSNGPLPEHPVTSDLEVTDFRLVEAPVLARLLTLASLTGIVDTLRGNGIDFKRMTGEVSLDDGTLQSELLRIYGSALGLTLKGQVDIDRNQMDLNGTVVPAYTINRILGEIPILGQLLVGGEGEGVIAVTYEMAGPVGDPEISVNPLSMLAPGFLRQLFTGSGIETGEEGEEGRATPPPQRRRPLR